MEGDPLVNWLNIVLSRPYDFTDDFLKVLYTPFLNRNWSVCEDWGGYDSYFHHWKFKSPCSTFNVEVTVMWGNEQKQENNDWSYDFYYAKDSDDDLANWSISTVHKDESNIRICNLINLSGNIISDSNLTEKDYLRYIKTKRAHEQFILDFVSQKG